MAAFNEEYRFGSSRWADEREKAPLRRREGLYLGVDYQGRPYKHPNDGPALMVAGSAAGKALMGGIVYNACTYPGSALLTDFKAELASISLAVQVALGKWAFCINPAGLLGLPNHTPDPADILKADSRTLVPDAKMLAEMLVVLSGGGNSKYFEDKARALIEAILVALAEFNGQASLRELYRIIAAIGGEPELWFSFLERMLSSVYEHVRSTAGELIDKQKNAVKEFSAIYGEAKNALSFLDDPAMLRGKPDFSLSILCDRRCTVYINIPAEYIGIWAPYLRLVIGVAMLYKQRRPEAPRVVFLLDECGQLGRNPAFLMRALTFGRGSGVLTQAVYQSFGQLATQFGREGAQTAIGSCTTRQIFGVRDLETAEMVSRMLGNATIEFDQSLEQAAARRNKAHIAHELLAGGDPFEAGLNYAQQARASVHRVKMARPLMDPSEILRMPANRQILQVSGINCPPVDGYLTPYFFHKELAGKFHPNKYHPPLDRVRVRTFWGMRWKKVITEPVPKEFRDWPQFQSGIISYIAGYRPF